MERMSGRESIVSNAAQILRKNNGWEETIRIDKHKDTEDLPVTSFSRPLRFQGRRENGSLEALSQVKWKMKILGVCFKFKQKIVEGKNLEKRKSSGDAGQILESKDVKMRSKMTLSKNSIEK